MGILSLGQEEQTDQPPQPTVENPFVNFLKDAERAETHYDRMWTGIKETAAEVYESGPTFAIRRAADAAAADETYDPSEYVGKDELNTHFHTDMFTEEMSFERATLEHGWSEQRRAHEEAIADAPQDIGSKAIRMIVGGSAGFFADPINTTLFFAAGPVLAVAARPIIAPLLAAGHAKTAAIAAQLFKPAAKGLGATAKIGAGAVTDVSINAASSLTSYVADKQTMQDPDFRNVMFNAIAIPVGFAGLRAFKHFTVNGKKRLNGLGAEFADSRQTGSFRDGVINIAKEDFILDPAEAPTKIFGSLVESYTGVRAKTNAEAVVALFRLKRAGGLPERDVRLLNDILYQEGKKPFLPETPRKQLYDPLAHDQADLGKAKELEDRSVKPEQEMQHVEAQTKQISEEMKAIQEQQESLLEKQTQLLAQAKQLPDKQNLNPDTDLFHELPNLLNASLGSKRPIPVNRIKKLMTRVSSDEREAFGLDEFLKDKETVTKQELMAFLETKKMPYKTQILEKDEMDYQHKSITLRGGGEDPRAYLFSFPTLSYDANGKSNMREEFNEPHFGMRGKNLFLDILAKVQKINRGETALVASEIQSEWAQRGKARGYKGEEPDPKVVAEFNSLEASAGQAREAWLQILKKNKNFGFESYRSAEDAIQNTKNPSKTLNISSADLAAYQKQIELRADLQEFGQENQVSSGTIPHMPIKNEILTFAINRLIKEAVLSGADGIAWKTGEDVAAAYSHASPKRFKRILTGMKKEYNERARSVVKKIADKTGSVVERVDAGEPNTDFKMIYSGPNITADHLRVVARETTNLEVAEEAHRIADRADDGVDPEELLVGSQHTYELARLLGGKVQHMSIKGPQPVLWYMKFSQQLIDAVTTPDPADALAVEVQNIIDASEQMQKELQESQKRIEAIIKKVIPCKGSRM